MLWFDEKVYLTYVYAGETILFLTTMRNNLIIQHILAPINYIFYYTYTIWFLQMTLASNVTAIIRSISVFYNIFITIYSIVFLLFWRVFKVWGSYFSSSWWWFWGWSVWLDMVDGGYKSFLYSVLSRDKWVCSEISSHVMMCYCAREKKAEIHF